MLSNEATTEILYDQLAAAPHVAEIYKAVVALEESAEDSANAYHVKKQRQAKRAEDARLVALRAQQRYDEAGADHRSTAGLRSVEAKKKEAKAEADKLAKMRPPAIASGIESTKVAAEIQKYANVAQRMRAGLKTIAESSAAALEKVQADRANFKSELLSTLKTPNALEEAEAIFDKGLDSLVAKQRKWLIGSVFHNEVDEETGRVRPRRLELPTNPIDGTPDATALLLLSAEPLVRAAGKRRIREAWDSKFEFEVTLTADERTKKLASLTKKIRDIEELEAAHIRALALAGACPPIRRDIDLKVLFGLEPIPESKQAFEAEQAERRRPDYASSRSNNGHVKIIRP